jgi:hypothetical protein
MISKKDAGFAPSHVCPPLASAFGRTASQINSERISGNREFLANSRKISMRKRGGAPTETEMVGEDRSISACAPPVSIRSTPHLISGYPYLVTGFAGWRRYP